MLYYNNQPYYPKRNKGIELFVVYRLPLTRILATASPRDSSNLHTCTINWDLPQLLKNYKYFM